MGTRPTDTFRSQRSICSRKPSCLANSDYMERRRPTALRRSAPQSRAGPPPISRLPRVQWGPAPSLPDPPARDQAGCVPRTARAPVGPGLVHDRAGQPGRGLAPRREVRVRDGHAHHAEHDICLVRVRPFRGERDGQERLGVGRAVWWCGAARARPADNQHAPRVAARGRAETRAAAWFCHAVVEVGRARVGGRGRDRVWGYERDRTVRRDAPRTKRVVGRLGGAEEAGQAGGVTGGRGRGRGRGDVGISAAVRVPAW